ncbi:MAG: YraN family protein [Patescibacteria group bacterium]
MKEFNLQTGKIGEAIAKEYLEKQGYVILEQNYETKYAEIDLVAEKDKTLVIVEVRTKRGDLFGTPEDSLNKKKLRKLWLNAQGYVNQARWKGPYRVDAICIILKADNSIDRLNHYSSII